MKVIKSKYVEFLLAPANAIDNADVVVTSDGVTCKLVYQATFNNEDGRFDDRLDDICRDKYGSSLEVIKNLWTGRLGKLSDYWHLVKMIKV